MAEPETAFLEALEAALADLGLALDEEARRKLLSHYRLLQQWNRRVSLTTVRDPREMAFRHFGESLLLARALPPEIQSALDVGSGPGFPGLPLAALRPDVQVTLLESVQRKAVFLREASRDWGNVEVRNERLERLSGEWDVSAMRAVAMREALSHLARLSRRTALLMGAEGVAEAQKAPQFVWETPIPLPWGARRFLLCGQRVAD